MADPRTFTVKQCEPAYLQNSGAAIASATSDRRDFFNSIGKIGDLAILNDIGGGKVGRGLRTLASISNSIRVGTGSLPTSIGKTLDSGANWVLQTTGVAPSTVEALRGFNPGVANQAYGQAKVIFNQVKKGNFKFKDIPFFLQDIQNLERLGRGIFTPGQGDVQSSLGDRCDASPYAIDLVARAPKYKFLFVVQFIPQTGYGPLGGQDFGPLDMAFTVKTSTRPNIKYQTDDVNYYNYRTKVVTKAEFEPMTMTFHDDTQNYATMFYHSYTRAMSPITGIDSAGAHSDILEQSGMEFVGNTLSSNQILNQIPASKYASMTGPLADDRKQVFKEIRIYHLFDNGNRMNVWRFYNPVINALSLDDLDMSIGSEGSQLSLSFTYDTVFLDPDVSLSSDSKYNLRQTQRGAVYPLRYNGSSTGGGGSPSNRFNPASSPTQIISDGINDPELAGITNKLSPDSIRAQLPAIPSIPSAGDLARKYTKDLGSLPFNL